MLTTCASTHMNALIHPYTHTHVHCTHTHTVTLTHIHTGTRNTIPSHSRGKRKDKKKKILLDPFALMYVLLCALTGTYYTTRTHIDDERRMVLRGTIASTPTATVSTRKKNSPKEKLLLSERPKSSNQPTI